MQPITTARRILVIDDNDAIHGDFKKILVTNAAPSKLAGAKAALFGSAAVATAVPANRFNYEVDSALQGEEGLKKLQQAVEEGRPYSVAFVDMRMPPGWDGLQTIQRLWEVDSDLQVVICSAFSDYSWDDISQRLGLTDRLLILKKPFDPAEVTQLATALSEKWTLRREVRSKMENLEAMVAERTLELTQLAMYDKLTGLANRTLFNERLSKAVARAASTPGYAFAVLFLDFDRFKYINDSLGHESGDKVLRGVAERITAALTLAGPIVGDSVAARLGGDEFTILIDGVSDTLNPGAFAGNLLQILEAPYTLDSRPVHCTASIGITTSQLQYTRADDVVRDADTAMYHAKAAGKARYVLFDRRMHEEVTRRLEMENDLRHALERNEFVLHYQPIISLSTGRIHGFEALVRWQHPRRGFVSPLQFIPYCEEIGLIAPVGLWILSQACQQLKIWTAKYPHLADLTMSVNMSAKQLKSPDFHAQIAEVISASGVRPQNITLEITESAMISDFDSAVATLKSLRSLGVQLHLDDFGTGYSSLSSLHQFPLTGIKIDRSFISNVSERRDYMAVVQAIINLATHLGMTLIAEGIETADQVALLQAMDCHLVQGFHFAKPGDVAAAEAFIDSQPVERAVAA